MEDPNALLESQYPTGIVLSQHGRHSKEKPRWYLKISQEPHQVNSHNKAIGLGLFFKHQPYDYTNDELNLPQGHEDRICMVDLLPANRKQHEDEADDSVLPQIGWNAHWKLTPLSTGVLVLGCGNAL